GASATSAEPLAGAIGVTTDCIAAGANATASSTMALGAVGGSMGASEAIAATTSAVAATGSDAAAGSTSACSGTGGAVWDISNAWAMGLSIGAESSSSDILSCRVEAPATSGAPCVDSEKAASSNPVCAFSAGPEAPWRYLAKDSPGRISKV